MAYPLFSKIDDRVYNSILSNGKTDTNGYNVNLTQEATSLFPWVRLISGTQRSGQKGTGLIMESNPSVQNVFDDYTTFDSQGIPRLVEGTPSLYGGRKTSGMIGTDWDGNAIYPLQTPIMGDLILRPGPLVQSLEIKEGKDQISRHCTVVIKCFSLGQAELLQEYLMEPGHTLLVEYGWNIESGYNEAIDTSSPVSIIENATDLLDWNRLMRKRLDSEGNYDAFYGFIVGGSLTSENDKFLLTIKLRGAPGLPVWLQGQHTILPLNKTTKQITEVPTTLTYSVADISADKKDKATTDQAMGGRRYKWMFNKLPGNRQTPEVQKIIDKVYTDNVYGWWDMVNFDYKIQRAVAEWVAGSGGFIDGIKSIFGEKEIEIGGLSIPREKLVSKNKYIQFGLALEILNSNNGLYAYQLGKKEVKCRIATSGFIGAFPGIFSTKPQKLLIPGNIPDFYKFFCSTTPIAIEDILKTPYINNSIYGKAYVEEGGKEVIKNVPISFVQDADMPPVSLIEQLKKENKEYNGYYEKGGYYGRLEFLYINFDVFLNVLKNSINKSLKDIIIELCNEMSSAVNSFWNLQVIEIPYEDEVVLTIVDENWRGYLNNKKDKVKNFFHTGEQSVFLEANLDIDIPAEMTNQIVLKREDYASNPNSKGIDIGGLFGNSKDAFFTAVDFRMSRGKEKASAAMSKTATPSKTANELKTDYKTALKSLKNNLPSKSKSAIENALAGLSLAGGAAAGGTPSVASAGGVITYYNDKNEWVLIETFSAADAISTQLGANNSNKKYNTATAEGDKLQKLEEEIKTAEDAEKNTKETALSTNLEKIDIVPNPSVNIIVPDTLNPAKGFTEFNKNFKIYCCDDTQLFEVIKNNAFEAYGGIEKTSHPLPIKYNFKILGKSGIRRGDTFNIIGIPIKYRKYGFFQITEIDQILEDNKWYTNITGQYFQQIKMVE